MITQIRADLYRQRHSLGLYLTVIAIIGYAGATVVNHSVGGITVNTGKELAALAHRQWTLLDSVHAATVSASVLVYLLIGMFTLVIGYEFSQKVYKNTLCTGLSRLQFVLAKYLTLVADLLGAMALYYLTTLFTAAMLGRPLGESLQALVGETVTNTLATTFFVSVIFSLAILLLILTGSVVVSAVFVVVWPLLVSTVTLLSQWRWLDYLDFFGVIQRIGFGVIKLGQVVSYIAVSVGLLVASTALATGLIRRQEL